MSEDHSFIGQAAGDCLKAVFNLQGSDALVATSVLAGSLGVTEPTVTAMVKRLAKLGLLRHVPYKGVHLTPRGERVALEIVRHHRLLELYLVQALGLGWDQVHAEADRLEHFISEELEARMDDILGHPTIDPHGDPIPSREGSLPESDDCLLQYLEPGEVATVSRVPDGNPALLLYLAEVGLVPGAPVRLLAKDPFGGPLTLEVGPHRRSIGRQLAQAIHVHPHGLGAGEPEL